MVRKFTTDVTIRVAIHTILSTPVQLLATICFDKTTKIHTQTESEIAGFDCPDRMLEPFPYVDLIVHSKKSKEIHR
jgi:hypothetical protein